MRIKAWKTSEVEAHDYYESEMYEAINDFNMATSEDELVDAFNRWMHFAELCGRKVV